MQLDATFPVSLADTQTLVLGIDSCGPMGSVALARLQGESAELLGEIELEGRSYSATLVPSIEKLLACHGASLSLLHAIVAVNGPGSFTGVRVGLSSVKGLAEPARIPVVPVSRLEVLAWKAGVGSSALDAHRHEIFLRLGEVGADAREMLAGSEELASIKAVPSRIAACDESAIALLHEIWPKVEIVRAQPPAASDALRLCAPRILKGDFLDLALLDGHYLRRSDAEIFGGKGKAPIS